MNPLTDKYGPLPGWGWAAVAGGGFLLWRWWKGRQAGGSSSGGISAGPGMAAPAEPTATLSTPNGFSYSGPLSGLGLFPGTSAAPTGAMAVTSGSSAKPPPAPASVVTSVSGQQFVPLGANPQYLLGAGTPTGNPAYYESAPNVFTPVPSYQSNPTYGPWVNPGTQIYVPYGSSGGNV